MPTILVYGDSNTHGVAPMKDIMTSDRYPKGVRWPSVMAQTLGASYDVIEEGHGGRTTTHVDPLAVSNRNGADLLPVMLESHRPIDLVVMMLGTNDLKAHLNLSAMEVGLGIEKLCALIAASESGLALAAPDVMLVSPPHILEVGFFADMFKGGAEKSRDVAGFVQATAKRHGYGFFDAATVAQVDAKEGIHFDAENHGALGRAMAEQVRARMPE